MERTTKLYDSFFVHVHLHHVHKCSLNRAIRSPITRLSNLSYLSPRPCYSIRLKKWHRKVTTSIESWSPFEAFAGKNLPFLSNDPAFPGSSTIRASFPSYAMLPLRRPTTLRACGIFARRSLPVVPSSPLAVWASCPSLLRSIRMVMITPGYALAPLIGTPEPANACGNPSRSVLYSSDRRTKQGIASGIGADSTSAASCRTRVIQYVVPHVLSLLCSFPILIVKHHEQ
ncbi:hypothetical protein ACH5RR_029931 [Cinchona calisaya]|uniref:Uncharacterized protein n=1 Tax=Cinchona calisaya TaxID=153742 RepID=A0ABD2YT35_9GENT